MSQWNQMWSALQEHDHFIAIAITMIKNYYLGVNTPNATIRQHFVPLNPPIFQQAVTKESEIWD